MVNFWDNLGENFNKFGNWAKETIGGLVGTATDSAKGILGLPNTVISVVKWGAIILGVALILFLLIPLLHPKETSQTVLGVADKIPSIAAATRASSMVTG